MNTEAIRAQTANVDANRQALANLEIQLAKLQMRYGQDQASLHINGVKFELTWLGRETGWYPQAESALNAMRLEAVKFIQAKIAIQRSKTEGQEWKLKQLAKATK
jgi:hypothetical protein